MASKVKEVILPLYPFENPAGVLHSSLESPAQERHRAIGAGPEWDHGDDWGLENLSCENRQRELGFFQPGEEMVLGRPYYGLSVPKRGLLT